ncbi:MAG: putative transport system permease protein [Actinomycetota bacterium]|jgi:ABC-type antimicrobial peptide transport system permease subunit
MGFIAGYAGNELKRRKGRALVTALGLAAGVALVLSIVGTSAGLADAQDRALTPLSSVGTDILVTRGAADDTTADATATGPTTNSDSATAGSTDTPRVQRFGPGGFGNDANEFAEETKAVTTDLSKLGNPGDKFTHDFFVASAGLTFDDDVLSRLGNVSGVDQAVAGLTMVATHQTGTVPAIVAEIQTGGDTVEQNVKITPQTDEERAATQACLQAKGAITNDDGGTVTVSPPPDGDGGPPKGGQGFRSLGGGEFEECLPARFREQIARFTIPQRTLQQALNPPQTDITSTTYTAGGVDPTHPDAGLVTANQVTDGRYIAKDATNEVMVAVNYAKEHKLTVGGELIVNDKTYKIVGLVQPAVQGSAADIYWSLPALQELSSRAGRINTVLVKTDSAADVETVAAAIRKEFPDAQVVTTASLAAQVTGSLKDTKKLADRFGGVLAILVLTAAFGLAALLTLGSVGKRVREIGTLRAIGWPRRLVMRQILVETVGISALGAVLGVGLGLGAGAAIGQFSPTLSATVPTVNSSARLLQSVGQTAANTATTSTLHLTVPVDVTTIALGVFLALLGGLLAGAIGASRAARLQPAVALRDLG